MGHNWAITISSKAEKEIVSSWNWYEEIQKKLGDKFFEEVLKKIEKIAENPFLHPKKLKEFREAQLKIFPFLIVFKVNEKRNIIRIVSVFHTSRNPYKKYKA